MSPIRRKNGSPFWVIIVLGLFTAFLTLTWLRTPKYIETVSSSISSHAEEKPSIDHSASIITNSGLTHEETWKTKAASLVKGKPTEHFKDNLLPDVNYITVWVSGGWTNDFMSYINMIYLSTLTGRTPILPPFYPSHVSWAGGFIYFSEIFDLPRMSRRVYLTRMRKLDVGRPGALSVQRTTDYRDQVSSLINCAWTFRIRAFLNLPCV